MAKVNDNQFRDDCVKALYQQTAAWKTFAKDIYYFCQTQLLEWPCLSLDWLPDHKTMMPSCDYTLQYLATGTQAMTSSQNAINIYEFAIPIEEEDLNEFYEGKKRPGKDHRCAYVNVRGHSRIDQVIHVDNPVLTLRAMPQCSDILSVRQASSNVEVFDLAQTETETVEKICKNESGDESNKVSVMRKKDNLKSLLTLNGHSLPGFAMEWSKVRPGYLCTAGDDRKILVWDLKQPLLDVQNSSVSPYLEFEDVEPVKSVSWHPTHETIMLSCGESNINMWDLRQRHPAIRMEKAHGISTNGVDFHHFSSYLFATCGSDHIANVWDMRFLDYPSQSLVYHSNALYNIQWAPFSDTVLATSGADRRVVLWDTQKVGMLGTYNDDEYAPPELSFIHSGHLTRISDFRWSPGLEDEWLIASADMSNTLQIFRPRRDLVYDYIALDMFDMQFSDKKFHDQRTKKDLEVNKIQDDKED